MKLAVNLSPTSDNDFATRQAPPAPANGAALPQRGPMNTESDPVAERTAVYEELKARGEVIPHDPKRNPPEKKPTKHTELF